MIKSLPDPKEAPGQCATSVLRGTFAVGTHSMCTAANCLVFSRTGAAEATGRSTKLGKLTRNAGTAVAAT